MDKARPVASGQQICIRMLSEFKILYRTHIICLLSLERTLGSEIDADIFLQYPVSAQEYMLRGFLGEAFEGFLGEAFDLIPSIIESIQQVSQTCVEYVSFP